MIGTIGLILAAALVTYATRIAGFRLAQRQLPAVFGRLLTYIPVSIFAALIAPDLGLGTIEAPARLLGVAVAALAVWRTRQLWAGLAAGMLIFWLVRAFG